MSNAFSKEQNLTVSNEFSDEQKGRIREVVKKLMIAGEENRLSEAVTFEIFSPDGNSIIVLPKGSTGEIPSMAGVGIDHYIGESYRAFIAGAAAISGLGKTVGLSVAGNGVECNSLEGLEELADGLITAKDKTQDPKRRINTGGASVGVGGRQ